eukprot:5509610-Alexandrium_andersonii.AAC.1
MRCCCFADSSSSTTCWSSAASRWSGDGCGIRDSSYPSMASRMPLATASSWGSPELERAATQSTKAWMTGGLGGAEAGGASHWPSGLSPMVWGESGMGD